MTRLNFFRNLRTAIFLLIATAIVAAGAGLWWANATGMPEEWRRRIEDEIAARHGIHVTIERLSYLPFHGGLVATEIRVYSDQTRATEVSRLQRVALDFDKTQLGRGEVKLTRLSLIDGRLDFPVDPENPDGERLEAEHVNATIAMPGGRLLEIRDASGQIEGIDVTLTARVLGYRPSLGSGGNDNDGRKAALETLKRSLNEASKWKFDDEERPKVGLFIEGDFADRSSLHGVVKINAGRIEKGGHTLHSVKAEGEWSGSLLTLNSIRAEDGRGAVEGRVDYDMNDREGRFGLTSSLDLPRLLRTWFGVAAIRDFTFAGEQKIDTHGSFRLVAGGPPDLKLTGTVACRSLMIRGVELDTLESAFSWHAGDLLMRDLKATRGGRRLTGKMLIQNSSLRAAIETDFPLAMARPFFTGQPFGQVLNDFTENEQTKVAVKVEFGWTFGDVRSWVVTGRAKLENCSYRGAPFLSAETDLDLSSGQLDFRNGNVVFDYRGYVLQRAYDGSKTGATKVKQVRYDAVSKVVEIEEVDGTFWPAPLVRIFARGVADNLEPYRFHQPPLIQGSGVVDVTPQGRTDLKISFRSTARADYQFAGKRWSLEAPSGTVRVQNDRVAVDNLAFQTFGGPVTGRVTRLAGRETKLNGEFVWTRLSFNELAELYEFDPKGGGRLTGRIEFSTGPDGIPSLNGKGLVALEGAELFSVPIFGPLSPLISGILADRRAGFQRAKDAFCTFQIRDGLWSTNDFRTSTSSLVFTGDARVDLDKLTLDMIMRMNARGLLGVITLPLKPFYGMFQFHGSGPLKDPEWRNVMFTSPPKDQQDTLMTVPKAISVPEEGVEPVRERPRRTRR